MPMTRSTPSLIGETQPIIRIVEVLPAPLGPRNPNDSPGATSKSIASTATNSPKRLVRPRAWMSEGGDVSCMNPESYPTVGGSGSGSGLPAIRHRADVERHDAARHALPRDVAQTRLAHDLGDPIRPRVALHAPDEVAVGGTLPGHAADDRHDPVEPELEDPGRAALRPGDLQAHDSPTRADRSRHLGEPLAIVREVAHPEGD